MVAISRAVVAGIICEE
jgi:hypothetical protein